MRFAKNLNLAKWSDLTEAQPLDTLTSVEKDFLGSYINNQSSQLTPLQAEFCSNGVVVLKKFLPNGLMERYIRLRESLPKDRSQKDNFWAGWHYPTPFMVHEELRDLALFENMNGVLQELVGEEMGLNLALTGWVSTERNFHQDSYLNPPFLWSNYLAVWMALEDVHPDSGPFQYVPGSHRWETLRREKLFSYLTPDQQGSAHWPTFTQDEVARVCEEEIEKRKAKIVDFVPQRGDVLIWHSNLMHRGSEPKDKSLLRQALICHYSAVSKRKDMPLTRRMPKTNGVYFDLPVPVK